MSEIIPGLPDMACETIPDLPTLELVIARNHQNHIPKELVVFATEYTVWTVNHVSRILKDRDVNATNGILLGFLMARAYMDTSDFLKRFIELPKTFQMLVISTLRTISDFEKAQKLIDWVYIVTELAALEKTFPGQLNWQDYRDAHNPELGSQFHHSVDYIKARLSGDVIF